MLLFYLVIGLVTSIFLNAYLYEFFSKRKLFDPINDVYTFEGDLVSVGEENIVLKTEITEIEISFSNIKKAKIEFKQFKERVKG